VRLRAFGPLVLLLVAAVTAFWYYRERFQPGGQPAELADGEWLEHLHSQNPKVAHEAERQLEELGVKALPQIESALREPDTDVATRKAALKAVGLLGPVATPALPEVAAQLPDPELTEEAAVALSFIGREAYGPLRDAARSDDPVVRREALRSLGKLRERAPLDSRAVVPLLLDGLADPDPGVRVVAATYLGIIHETGATVVPALIETLRDEHSEVRAAAAAALGSFGSEGITAIPALKKAAADKNEEVAREAGLAIVKLQSSSRK
jgi:HEAT repeat protein